MNNKYRFTSDAEPTIQELELLMTEVIKDVKSRAKAADLKFKKLQKEQINLVFERQRQLNYNVKI